MILYINSKARIPVLRDTISRSYSLTDSKLHTRSRAHHRYNKTTTPWRKQRTSATSVFPISMTNPTFWRKSWKQRNYTALYYRVAFPWHVASSKLQTLKGPSGPHPVRDQNQRRRDGEKESREGNGGGFTRVSWIQFPMMVLVNNEGKYTKITNFMNPAQGQMETIT